MRYFLGADVGGTKTHTAVCDENGNLLGFGVSGPGNPQGVGMDGLLHTLQVGIKTALEISDLSISDISGAGFGIAGYDWPSSKPAMAATISKLGLSTKWEIINDTVLGLVAGAKDGWGISIVSGTGCNCRGWDRLHQNEGRVTGYGEIMGEGAGAIELVSHAIQTINQSWYKRLPPTSLSEVFINLVGAKSLDDLIEGITLQRYRIDNSAAQLVLQAADSGDYLAQEVVRWAGNELGQMVLGVARQLSFENLDFDVVMIGSMFKSSALLVSSMEETIRDVLKGANLVHLESPPVLGAVFIGMEQGSAVIDQNVRVKLSKSLAVAAASI